MAEPVRKTGKSWAPDHEVSGDIGEQAVLQRWVEQPDGRWRLLELPLTRELFLNPELDDKMLQGEGHDLTCREITTLPW